MDNTYVEWLRMATEGSEQEKLNAFESLGVPYQSMNDAQKKMVLTRTAAAYNAMKGSPQVEEWLKMAIAKGDEQKKLEVDKGLGIPRVNQSLNNPHQAIKYYEKTLEIAKQRQDQRMERNAYHGLADSNFRQANFQKAIDYYRKELQLATKLDDKASVARVHSDLGVVYESLGDYATAIELSEKALAIGVTAGNKLVEASANGNLGNVCLKQGDYHKAIKYHERQLQISTDIGYVQGQAQAYNSLGSEYKSLGNYYEELKYHKKSLKMFIETGDKMGEARVHASLGVAYDLVGEYNEAMAHTKKCIEISKQIEDRYGEGRAVGDLGAFLLKMDKIEEAVDCFEESLKIAREVNDRQNEGTAYINLGKCKILLSQYEEASEMIDKQIRWAEEIGDKYQKAMGYCNKGVFYLLLKDHEQAIHCFEKQLKISQDTDNKSEEAHSYQALGRSYGDLFVQSQLNENNGKQEKGEQYITKSTHYLRESLRCREWIFDHLQQQDHLKISILETFIIDYNYLTTLLIANNEHKEALLVSERGRARALDDLLVSKYNLNQDNQTRRDPISYAAIENMASDCSILFYSMQMMFQCTWIIPSVDSSARLLGIDESGLSDIVNSAYNTLKVREVQCEDRSIQTDEPQAKQKLSVPHKSDALDVTEKLLLSSYEMIKKRDIIEEDLYDGDNPHPLEGLYKALISPVLHLITKDELVIIPDGVLFTVPFAALRDPNTGEFLSETKRIRLAPSLTSLKALQESPADFHCKTGALIIGNPKVGKVRFRGMTREIADLPGAEQEAQMIGELLGVKPFIGSQATKMAIKQLLQEGVAVIHFAAHGTTDGEIFLTPSSTGGLASEEDYILTMKDVQESGVRPQLVVLSCCHSGRGEIKAEGVVGMSRAFLASGARAVVASLWAIADDATMVFMEKFYTHLKQGESTSRSLQQAMKDMRELPGYSDPQYWAPFFLIGDDVIIKM